MHQPTWKWWLALIAALWAFISSFASPVSFSNTNFITIVDSENFPTVAAPYPSSITVSGLDGLVLSKVTVTLQGLSHQFPSDVSVLLIGPRGQAAIVMSEVGGQRQFSVTNITLTLDDEAPNSLPVFTQLSSGTFRPTEGYLALGYPNLPYDFPAPAPHGNSNAPALLSVFKNTDPNGTWNLFVVDDASGNSGSISQGWVLNLTAGVSLSINHVGTNMILSWPKAVSNCTPQICSNLGGNWTNLAGMPGIVSDRWTATNPISASGTAFYRLIK
jgi:subtilisin-like proprotein convertase family protein